MIKQFLLEHKSEDVKQPFGRLRTRWRDQMRENTHKIVEK
jgi:hypothetical protein